MTTQSNEDVRRHGYRSPLWAFLLIALGAIWLLFEAKILSSANLAVLLRLWPLILIGLGLELLIGRNSRFLSLLVGFGTIALLLVLMLAGPTLGLVPNIEVKTAQYSEPVGDSTAAQINLNLSVGRTTIRALSDSADLITADLRYVGDTVSFNATNTDGEKSVTLTSSGDPAQWYDFLGLFRSQANDASDLFWNIGLSPNVPLDLHLNGGVGDNTFDLSGLQLSHLTYKGGVGDTTLSLPGSGSYSLDFNGGVGKLVVNFADGAGVNASVDAGVGEITFDVPADAPVSLEATGGLGQVHVPANYTRISGDESNGLSRVGVWQSPTYSAASDSARIIIQFKGGVGNLNIQ
ncbi:MAG: hypothetical protein GC204_16380 [Chloroflexi bacterium]|nr:hypothetical protein [Chloroflexota bacterium]